MIIDAPEQVVNAKERQDYSFSESALINENNSFHSIHAIKRVIYCRAFHKRIYFIPQQRIHSRQELTKDHFHPMQ